MASPASSPTRPSAQAGVAPDLRFDVGQGFDQIGGRGLGLLTDAADDLDRLMALAGITGVHDVDQCGHGIAAHGFDVAHDVRLVQDVRLFQGIEQPVGFVRRLIGEDGGGAHQDGGEDGDAGRGHRSLGGQMLSGRHVPSKISDGLGCLTFPNEAERRRL